MMGLSGLAAFLPATLLSPVAGIAADRYHRKHICILADLFIGFSAMIFAVLLWKYDMPVWTALVVLFFRSYPLMTSDYFHASAWHGSAVEVLYAVGMMTAAFLFGSIIKVKRHLLFSYFGLLGIGIVSAIGGVLPPKMWAWFIFAIICGIMGAFGNVHSIPLIAYMQTTIPAEKMGRAFALIALAASLSMPLGLLISSPIAEKVGVNIWFLISGIGTTVITLISLWIHHKIATPANGKMKDT